MPIARRRSGFLAELVKVPSDNPPGDCVAHAARAAELLEQMGFEVERHPVPEPVGPRGGHGGRHQSRRPATFRPGPGRGPERPWRRRAAGQPAGPRIPTGRRSWTAGCTAAASPSRSPTSRPMRSRMRALVEAAAPKRGTVELHLTYDEEAGGEIGPKWLLDQGISRPDSRSPPASATPSSPRTMAAFISRSR